MKLRWIRGEFAHNYLEPRAKRPKRLNLAIASTARPLEILDVLLGQIETQFPGEVLG